jgi:hypothetical protein
MADDILDPAHDPDAGVTHAGAAGIASPVKDGDKSEPKVSDDGNIVEVGGKKYITIDALHSERAEKKQLAETLSALDPLMPDFEEFVKTKRNGRAATVARATAPADDDAYSEDELDGLAIARGYYGEDNKPDRARAKQELDILTRVADRRAAKHVKPVADRSVADRAAQNKSRARTNTFVDGQPIADSKFIDAALSSLPDEYLADDNIANITQVIAAGLEYLDMRKTRAGKRGGGPPVRSSGRSEPMFVERGGGRFDDNEPEMTDLDRAAARARGKTPEQWAKLVKAANKGSELENI